jgi:stringent starvation protein B
MSPTQPLPPKKDVALALLERSSVYVHLDPRQAAVVVPPWFKKKLQLVLQIGLNMPVPIPDLRLDDDGMSCTLSFNGAQFFCVVPWSSVFAMVGDDGRGMVWPDDVPADVARQAQVREVETGAAKESTKSEVAREQKDGTTPAPAGRGRDLAEVRKAKRPRKRAVLAAVSDAADAGAAATPVKTARSEAEGPTLASQASASRPAVVPAPAAQHSGGAGARKKKKDLPPYLRVVK